MLTPQVKDSDHLARGIPGQVTSIDRSIKAIADEALGLFQISFGFAVLAAHNDADSTALLISSLEVGLLGCQLACDVVL